MNPSLYQSTPYAHTVLQHTAPAALYPTPPPPPPPGITSSSSSLAMALGDPTAQNAKKVYRPVESPAFFNNFLAQQSKPPEVNRIPRRHITVTKDDTPDPLALSPPEHRPEHTPKKRKADSVFELPSFKRKQSFEEHSSLPPTPTQPSQTRTNGNYVPKAKLQVFVEIPAPSKSGFTSSQGTSRSNSHPATQKKGGRTGQGDYDDPTVKSPTKRAMGDRDERGNYLLNCRPAKLTLLAGPLDKFITLMEDIFEAEDSLPPDAEISDLSLEFFSPSTVDCSQPLLHPNIVKKLTSYISKVARPSKRLRLSSKEHNLKHPGTPRTRGRMAEVDATDISRLLRILERSLKVVEDIDPFHSNVLIPEPTGGSPKKAGKQSKPGNHGDRKRSKSKTPRPGEDVGSGDEAVEEGVTEADLTTLANSLLVARDAISAAECCITLLGSDRLTKQVGVV